MKRKLLFWAPRILTIAFILFLSLFALDVFDGKTPLPLIIVGLAIHLIPSFLLIALLVVAWRKETVGGALFITLALLFTVFFKTYENFLQFMTVSFPVFLVGFLFLIAKYKFKK